MRVRYGELRASERRKLAALDARIARFYADAVSALERDERDERWWRERASKIARGVTAERWHDGSLILRSRSRELTPLIERAVAAAPSALQVRPARPPRALGAVLQDLPNGSRFSRARFRAGFTRGHLIEVVITVPGGSGSDAERDAAEELVRQVLGDRRTDEWIGAVSTVAGPRESPLRVVADAKRAEPQLSLDDLPDTMERAVEGLYATLPDAASWTRTDRSDWVLLELEPEPQDEWPAQDDLMLTSTCEPELLKCFLSGAPFSSVRFSRLGELFFFLKYRSPGELDERLSERSALEDALDRSLVHAHAGRVIGGGLGLVYSYVDVVLSDVDAGFEAIRRAARALGVPPEAWIVPFDDALAEEWVGVVPEGPAPPGFDG